MTGSTIDHSGVGQLQSLYSQRSRKLDPAIPVQNSPVLVRSLDSRKAHEYSKVPAWVPYPIRYAQSVQTCRLEARKLVHLYALAVGRISSPIGALRNWAMAYSGHRSCVVELGCPTYNLTLALIIRNASERLVIRKQELLIVQGKELKKRSTGQNRGVNVAWSTPVS